ncbi:hypothetical protein EDEG_01870 [Edhazardia aedis USNM 41457]|uniref:Uncharacterized protein n=1 Tax=Edhazardia aedis (strain USNM 41457) TaxID=1003232 RepID=J8ZVY6_EDHAE|nr:hypothetical protein EDEG_01870 [Edhazardia aedis USNM 41457]|eukprot:EJW03838.1 hypothetical protein EDEG_01870 [Edhazardia aedis USNM 41457]
MHRIFHCDTIHEFSWEILNHHYKKMKLLQPVIMFSSAVYRKQPETQINGKIYLYLLRKDFVNGSKKLVIRQNDDAVVKLSIDKALFAEICELVECKTYNDSCDDYLFVSDDESCYSCVWKFIDTIDDIDKFLNYFKDLKNSDVSK